MNLLQLKLFKDKKTTFSCKLGITGASVNETFSRLLLQFNDTGKNLLFKGIIKSDGNCLIDIPPLKKYISENENSGNAVLEVIAESTFFEPLKMNFNIENSKNIMIENINIISKPDKKVIVKENNVKVNSLKNKIEKIVLKELTRIK